MVGVTLALRRRTAVAGDRIELLILADTVDELIGVDLESGAIVRAAAPPDTPALHPFDVVGAELAHAEPGWTPHAPEAVELADTPRRAGRLTGRRAGRYLRPFLHARNPHLLGFVGPAAPFWTLQGDRPSVAVVQPTAGPAVLATHRGYRCQFSWRGVDQDLPLADARLAASLERSGRLGFTGDALTRILGSRPSRLVVALAPPQGGYCYKVVAGLLPKP